MCMNIVGVVFDIWAFEIKHETNIKLKQKKMKRCEKMKQIGLVKIHTQLCLHVCLFMT